MKMPLIHAVISMFLLGQVTAYAQKKVSRSENAEAYVSKITKRKRGQTIDKFARMTDEEYVIRLVSGKGSTLVTYDSELKIVKTEEEPYEVKKKKDHGKADWMIFPFGKSRYLLKATTDRDRKRNVFSIVPVDEDDEELDEPTELATIEGDDYYYVIENAYLDYNYSEDGSLLLLSFKLPERRDKEGVKYKRYKYILFEEGLNVVWNRVVEFRHVGGRVSYGGNLRLSDEGEVYCWASVDRGRGFKKDDRFGINLYRVNEEDVIISNIKALRMNGVTSDLTDGVYSLFSTYGVGGFTMFGFGDPGGEVGFVSVKWTGADGEDPTVVRSPFGADHLAKNQPTKQRKKLKKRAARGKSVHVPYLVVDHIIRREDGSYIVLAQEQYSVTTTSRSGFTRTKYYNLDIHAFGMSSDFEIQWSTIIPLYQLSGTTVHSGYMYKLLNDKLYFIFNDNYKNLAKKEWNPTKKPHRFSGGEHPTTLVTVDTQDPDAKQERELLLEV